MAKKRANGEGNIRKRADGRWEGRYTAGYHPETGKRIIKNVLGKTQAECKAKLTKAMADCKSLDIGRAGEYTVAAWLRTWFGNVKKCAVGKHPKSEKLGGIESGRRLRLRPLPVLHRRQSQRVARIDPNAVVVDKNIAENDRFDLFSR